MRALLSWSESKMPEGLSIPWPSEKEHVLAGGCLLSELVESETLASISEDTVAGFLGEPEGADLQGLGELQ